MSDEDISLPLEHLKQRKMQKILIIVLILEFTFFVIFSIWIWTTERTAGITLNSIQVGTVKSGTFDIYVKAIGHLQPQHERWITSAVGGVITQIFVRPGMTVKRGTDLLKLGNEKLYDELEQSQLTLIQNKAKVITHEEQYSNQKYSLQEELQRALDNFEESKLNFAAVTGLYEHNVISRLDYESAKLKNEKEKAAVTALKKQIVALDLTERAHRRSDMSVMKSTEDLVNDNLRRITDLTPKADMDGQVEVIPVQVGQRITTGTPLVKLGSSQHYNAIVSVSMTSIGKVKLGQSAEVDIPGTNSSTLKGTVAQISPTPKKGMFSVTIHLNSEGLAYLHPYLPVVAVIRAGQITNTLYIEKPYDAKQDSAGAVFVLSPHNRKAIMHRVRYGVSSETGIQILSGLKKGDKVIISHIDRRSAIGDNQ